MHRHFLSKARLARQRLHSPIQHTPLLSLPVSMWCQFPKKRWQLLCWLLPAGQRPGPNRNRGPPPTQQQPLTVFLPRHPIHHPPLPPAIPFLLSSLTSPLLFVFLLDTHRCSPLEKNKNGNLLPIPIYRRSAHSTAPPPPALCKALPPCARLRTTPPTPAREAEPVKGNGHFTRGKILLI